MDIVERLRKTISNMDAPVENDLLREAADEIERLDYLHKLDHSLADQWRERADRAEAAHKIDVAAYGVEIGLRDQRIEQLQAALAEARKDAERLARKALVAAIDLWGLTDVSSKDVDAAIAAARGNG